MPAQLPSRSRALALLIVMATGSEVDLTLKAHEKLTEEGVKVRSISVPSVELFKHQSAENKQSLLPDTCRARISIEAASSLGWGKYIGLDGQHCGMDTFGASASAQESSGGVWVHGTADRCHCQEGDEGQEGARGRLSAPRGKWHVLLAAIIRANFIEKKYILKGTCIYVHIYMCVSCVASLHICIYTWICR